MIREVVKATGDISPSPATAPAGYSGDGGPATAAELRSPHRRRRRLRRATCSSPTIGNNVVREVVTATGDIITVAGNGTAGYSGDGGPATAAELNQPCGVAVDAAGDLFIADWINNVVREVVKATGDIITVAGDGTAGYSGDGGPATAAELDAPSLVAVDSAGDLFIADTYNNAVREVTPAVTVTVAQAAPADHFVVTTSFANPDVAGTAGTVTITAEDANGNVARIPGHRGPDQHRRPDRRPARHLHLHHQ